MNQKPNQKTRQMELHSWVFATANSVDKMIEPLLSRFVKLHVPQYTFEEFSKMALFKLKKENIEEPTAILIAEKVWNELDSRNIRDVIKVGRLASTPEDLASLVQIFKRHKINE